MSKHAIWPTFRFATIALPVILSVLLCAGATSIGNAQTATQSTPKIKAFYQLITGRWAQITDNARLSMTNTQLNIAALQCHETRKLGATNKINISSISSAVSQKLSKILVYQKNKNVLKRIDFDSRQLLLFPKLKIGKIRNGQDGFEISNNKIEVTISFGKIKQGNRSVPVMIEGKALYLKCPEPSN